MNKNILSIIIIGLVLAVGGYLIMANKKTDTTTTNQMPVVVNDGTPQPGLTVEPAAEKARKDLAAKLSVEENSIVILNIAENNWTDSCLGLGGPAESCLQAMIPGFRVEMLAEGKTYFYRTDKSGLTIRAETQ